MFHIEPTAALGPIRVDLKEEGDYRRTCLKPIMSKINE